MDAQLKRGLLENCVLAALAGESAHGYLIIKSLRGVIDVTESTLYPILRRLEAGGCVTVRSTEHNGRLRKVYSITAEGRSQLDQFYQSRQDVLRAYEFIGREISHDEA